MKRTRAIEILDEASIQYELGEFAATDFSAQEVAEKLKLSIESVYKTLVTRGERCGVIMALVRGDRELNLKLLANAAGEKRMELVRLDELQRLTGYLKGGCSPLGGKKAYPVYIDEGALEQPKISISAGVRGLQIIIAPHSLIEVAKAKVVKLSD